ncbi:MAG: restriction endonuclease subunit S [Thermales bacterium]|nr:restriction endonuclease subunit S [Thermales bacterium]
MLHLSPKNSLILCSRATIGDCGINLEPITTNQGFKNIIPNTRIMIEFLYYLIINRKNRLLQISNGSTFLEFSKKDLQNLQFQIPSKAEQKAITDILTTADDEIEELENKLELIKAQRKYLINNLVTGKIRLPEFIND